MTVSNISETRPHATLILISTLSIMYFQFNSTNSKNIQYLTMSNIGLICPMFDHFAISQQPDNIEHWFWYQNWVEFNFQFNGTNLKKVQYLTKSNIGLICPIFDNFAIYQQPDIIEHWFWYQNWVKFNLQANGTNFENVQ